MAIILAAASGNFNATSTWIGGVVPTTGDVAVANSRTITITADATCLEIRNDTTGGATATGGFVLGNGATLYANVYGNNTNGALCLQFNGNAGTSATVNAGASGVIYAGAIYFNVGVRNTGLGTLNVIAGNIYGTGGQGCYGADNTGGGTLNIGTASIPATITGAGQYSAVVNSSTGTINITGTVIASPTNAGGLGCQNAASGRVNFLAGSSFTAAGGGSYAVYNSGTGLITIAAGCTVAAGAYPLIANTSSGEIQINCPVTGGAAVAVTNASTGTVTINNTCTGGSAAAGAQNSSTGTLTVLRAKGNGFGPGSTGFTAAPGVVSSAAGSLTYVSEFEFGPRGQAPTAGPIRLTDATSNVAVFAKTASTTKTLIDATTVANALPAASNVRAGTTYNAGNTTGTMAVPVASAVQSGVAVGTGVGTAALTPADVWAYLTSNSLTSGSFGERLANAATVATTGQQIADSTTG